MPALSIEARCQATEQLKTSSYSVRKIMCRRRTPERRYEESSARAQLVVPTRGSFLHHVACGTVLADSTKALFVHKGEKYAYSHLTESGDDVLTFIFEEQVLRDLAPAFLAKVRADGHLSAPHRASLSAARLLAACRPGGFALAAEEHASALLTQILGIGGRGPEQHGGALTSHDRIALVKEHVAAAPERPWRLGDLARRAGLSPFYLTRLFKRLEGVSIHQYQQRLRMTEALARILDGERSFTKLAVDLGYSSHSHFTTVFRRHFGVTPRRAKTDLVRNARGQAC